MFIVPKRGKLKRPTEIGSIVQNVSLESWDLRPALNQVFATGPGDGVAQLQVVLCLMLRQLGTASRERAAADDPAGDGTTGQGVEEGTRLGRLLRISKSAQAGQANTECQGSMAESSGESWCIVFPDLQSAPRILHASQLGRSRCRGAAGDAAQQSRDEAPLSTGNG